MKPTLYLIRGIPGAGKSTFAKTLAGRDKLHVEADMYFESANGYEFDAGKLKEAHEWCQDRASLYLSSNVSVVVSNTSTTEKEVAVYKSIADKYQADFVSIIVENRHGNTNVHNVPSDVIDRMRHRFSIKL